MTQERRICVRGIIYKDGKLFTQRLKNKETGKVNKFWCTPGGGLDARESLHDGLHREMIEETGIAPVIGNLLLIQQFMDGDKELLEFFFHIKNADDYETINLAGTSHGELEIDNFGFVDPRKETVLPDTLQTLDLEKLITSPQPPIILNFFDKRS